MGALSLGVCVCVGGGGVVVGRAGGMTSQPSLLMTNSILLTHKHNPIHDLFTHH